MPCPEEEAVFLTERLRLDPLQSADALALLAYRGDPQIARYQGWQPASQAETEAFIAAQAERPFGEPDGWSQLAIRERHGGELLGDLGVHFPAGKDDPIELGVSLRPSSQRHGYAREASVRVISLAFNDWGYRRLACSVDPRNTASVELCRAVGMRLEAHHVESYRFRGEWADDLVFALLAREWPAASR